MTLTLHPTIWARACRCGLIGGIVAPTEHTPPGSSSKPPPLPPQVAWICPSCGRLVELRPS